MNSLEFRRNWTDPPVLGQGLLAQYLATWFTLCKNMPETGASRLTPQSRKGLMRAVAQIAQSVEQGIENPHDSFHTTALDSTPHKASLSMRGLFVMRLWSISGKFGVLNLGFKMITRSVQSIDI